MALGYEIFKSEGVKNNTSRGIAAIIATPLITGPAAITAIILSANDFGMFVTGLAMFTVLIMTAILFYFSSNIEHYLNETFVMVLTTILGLITVAWGVNFMFTGLKVIFGLGA